MQTTFCVYAWPSNYSSSGDRTFFVNQTGDITSTDDANYRGTDALSEESARTAFGSGGSLTSITGAVAVGTVGSENNDVWKPVN